MKVSVHQAKTHLSEILRQVAAGEEIIICHRDRPVAKLVAFQRLTRKDLRGDLRGKIRLAADFDATPPDFAGYQ